MGERIVRGRGIERTDTPDTQLVALINEEMARRYWARPRSDRRPLRDRHAVPSRPWVTVVGIVKDVHHNGLTGVVKEKFYVPHTQWARRSATPT